MTKVVTFVEIDVPMCGLQFSASPCAAEYSTSDINDSIPGYNDEGSSFTGLTYNDEGTTFVNLIYNDEGLLPGGGECFNSLNTCQDAGHYSEITNTVRFGYEDADDQGSIDYIPSLQSVSYRPQQISLEGDMGVRASITCTFRDHRDSDTHEAGDPYWAQRGYNPFEQGTFWGKWLARHYPKMQGAIIRYIVGKEGQNIENMECRTFIIEKITGPNKNGTVSITAKDILKLADDKKAQCPVLSTGRLSADLAESVTSATLSPSGVGDDEYPATGHVAIGGKEICSFTRSGDVLTLTRAQFNTEASAHDRNDIVQLCKEFFDGPNGLDPADIIYDLLVNYTTTPASWINLADWQQKTNVYLSGRRYYTLVAEPTSVKDLINELLEQGGLILYTDDLNQKIRLDVVRELTIQTELYDEDNIISNSFDCKKQLDKRLSQVWVWYGLRNPLEQLDEGINYRAAVSHVDTLAETLYGGQPAIKKIYSRWITTRPTGTDLCYKMLSRFRDPPSLVQWSAWRFGKSVPALAGRYNVSMWAFQSGTGEQVPVPAQVVKATPGDESVKVEAQEISWHTYDDQPDQGLMVVVTNDETDYNFRTEYDKAYAAPKSGDIVTCLIESGVKIGTSTNTGFAFTVGTWSEPGVILKIINNGYIVGKGGDGGNYPGSKDGEDGADALYTRQPVTIINNGTIAGGGGGGGVGVVTLLGAMYSSGGGGGAGYLFGIGGSGYMHDQDDNLGSDGTITEGGSAGYAILGVQGGSGGDLGQDGFDGSGLLFNGDGGLAGVAVDGNSYVTWEVTGTIAGSQIN
ncbi:hypothetical protein [Prosthecochloris sp.]|uniref:hypothetical protein n=1 Tax=Prosthecochloris sp. TaxID=290513 RepID=UPI00257D0EF7|nr:hypothetical protein [Prosthecochloris sp.]